MAWILLTHHPCQRLLPSCNKKIRITIIIISYFGLPFIAKVVLAAMGGTLIDLLLALKDVRAS
jgi:hypothetical protein